MPRRRPKTQRHRQSCPPFAEQSQGALGGLQALPYASPKATLSVGADTLLDFGGKSGAWGPLGSKRCKNWQRHRKRGSSSFKIRPQTWRRRRLKLATGSRTTSRAAAKSRKRFARRSNDDSLATSGEKRDRRERPFWCCQFWIWRRQSWSRRRLHRRLSERGFPLNSLSFSSLATKSDERKQWRPSPGC